MSNKAFTLLLVVGAAVVVATLIHFLAQHMIQTMNIGSGYIVKKGFSATYSHSTTETITIDGKTGTISGNRIEPEKFSIWIREANGDKTNWIYVPKDLWQDAVIGEYFDGDCFCIVPK